MNEKPVIRHNEAKNGIEIAFSERPDDSILDWLRGKKFRWSNYNKVWYKTYDTFMWKIVNDYFDGLGLTEPSVNPKIEPIVKKVENSELQANKYISRIKNAEKKKYAKEYQKWIKEGRDENKEPEYRGRSYMAGDEVRRTLRKFYPSQESPLKPAPTLESIARKYGMTILDLRPRLALGVNIEFEHTKDTKTAETIALQHLDENPRYYSDPKPENWAEKELEKESKPIATGRKPYNLETLVEDYKKQETDFEKNRLIEDFAYALSGDDNKKRRQALMTTLKGYKVTIAMSGIHNLIDALKMYVKNRVKEDKEVKAVAITLSTDEAAKLFEHYGLNEKQSLLMYELGIHSKDYAIAKMPEEIVKPLIQNGYIHADTYKYTGMSTMTDLGRTMFNMAAQRNIDEYMKRQKSPEPEPDDMTDTEKVTEEINEMFEGATTAEVTLEPKKPQMTKVELMRQHIWDEIPSYVKYAEPVKPVKFSRDPEDGILPKFLEPFTETDPITSLRPVMAGIYFDNGHIIATDAHTLIHLVTDSKAEGNYCITPTCLKRIEKKDRTKDGTQIDPVTHRFPNWKGILPADNKYHYTVDLLKLKTFAQICMRAKIVPEAAPACEFLFEDKDERLALSGLLLVKACDALMKLGHKEASMHFTEVSHAVYLMPTDAKQDTVEKILKSDFVLIMPMLLKNSAERYLRYDLRVGRVINSDGSIADIDTSITKNDVQQPIPDYLFSIMKQKAKKTTLPVIAFALVKNKKLRFTDLELDIYIDNVNLPDGFYQFFNDFLLPQEFEDPNDERGDFAKEEEFPVPFAQTKNLIYSFSDSRFTDVVAEAGDYIAKDELRPVMNAIHLIYDEKSKILRAFASDAHFMFIANLLPEIASPDLKHELNLGGQSNIISQIFKKHKFQDYKVQLFYASRVKEGNNFAPERVSIKFDNITIITRTGEYNPPKFLGVLPDIPFTKALTFDRDQFKRQFEEKKKADKRGFAVIIEPKETQELTFGHKYQGIYSFAEFPEGKLKTNLPFHQVAEGKNIVLWQAEGKNIAYLAVERWKVNGQWSRIDDESFAIQNIKPVLPESSESEKEVFGTFAGQVPAESMQKAFKPNVPIKEVFEKAGVKYPKLDMNGNRILTAEEWNKLSKAEQDELSKTITAPVTDLQGNTFQVDKGLAPYLQRILNLGLATGQSDSGMVGDHPNYRHVETGELLHLATGGTGAYLTFWKPEAKQVEETGRKINNQEQIDAIRKVAKESGLIAYDGQVFFQPSLGINFPETNDGSWRQDILTEANILLNQEHTEFGVTGDKHPSGDRFMEWLDLRNDVYVPKIVAKHDGMHFYTDEEIAGLWEKFVSGLEKEIPKIQMKPVKSSYKSKYEYFTKENAPDNIKDRFGISKTDDRQIIEDVPKTFSEKLKDGEQVFLVDGKYIRDNIYSDFGQGGNDMAYPEFVPIGEIWIEKALIAEKDEILSHELRERNLMVGQGMPDQKKALTYDEAHEIAKTMEDSERGTKPELSYEEFSKQYKELFNLMMKYSPKEAGSQIYAEKMADLSDKYPEYAKRIEGEKPAKEKYDNYNDFMAGYVKKFNPKYNIYTMVDIFRGGRDKVMSDVLKNRYTIDELKHFFNEAKASGLQEFQSDVYDRNLEWVENQVKERSATPKSEEAEIIEKFRTARTDINEKIKIAEGLGRVAREAGVVRVPANSFKLRKLLEGLKVGESEPLLTAWLKGWDEEHQKQTKIEPEPEKFGMDALRDEFNKNLTVLKPFMSESQLKALRQGFNGEEGKFFADKAKELAGIIEGMPKTYETDDIKAKDKIIHLHYFHGGSDWYIAEKDKNPDQNQMFGYTILNGDDINAEWGYISAIELRENNIELDFYFDPEKFSEIRKLEVSDVHKDEEKDEGYGTGTQFSESEGKLIRLENADKDEPDLRLDLSKFQPAKTQMDAVYLVNMYNNRYTTIQGNFDKFIAKHNELNSDLLFNPDNSKYYIASGKFIFELDNNPSQLDYYQQFGVQVGKSEPEKKAKPQKEDWEMTEDEYVEDQIKNHGANGRFSDAIRKRYRDIIKEKQPQTPGKSSLIASDYKSPYELNKAIEKLLDSKWNDKPESWSTDEITFIKNYSGYGGLEEVEGKGSLYEFYTPDKVIEKMWGLAYKYGYKEGRLLEPSVGVGEFLKRQYVKSMVIKDAYEVNKYSAKITKLLYPEVNVNDGKETKFFEELFIKDRYTIRDKVSPVHELVIGNPPYGKVGGVFMGMGEETYTNAHNYIDYFIFRGLDMLVPNGLLIYIIGTEVAAGGTPWLDQGSSKVKEAIAKKGKLIDAYRLPEGIFARTNVVSDIIVMKKRS